MGRAKATERSWEDLGPGEAPGQGSEVEEVGFTGEEWMEEKLGIYKCMSATLSSILFRLLTSEETGWLYLQEIQRYGLWLTLEDRKVNAVDFTSAFSLSTRRRVLSSRRLRYFPVVTWRSLKGWPHLIWLPLHLRQTGQIDPTAATPQGRQQVDCACQREHRALPVLPCCKFSNTSGRWWC